MGRLICVLNNRELSMVSWEQRVNAGDPKFTASPMLPPFPCARYAEMLGLKGIELKDPERIGAVWEEALTCDRPVVVDAHTDPNVAPLPPHLSFDQAKAYLSSLIKGDPDAVGIARQSTKDLMETWLPHGRKS